MRGAHATAHYRGRNENTGLPVNIFAIAKTGIMQA